MAEPKGVWRTVRGRRIFIGEGEDLATAMKKSGKFKSVFGQDISDKFGNENNNIFVRDINEAKNEISNQIAKMKKMGIKDDNIEGTIYCKTKYGESTCSNHWGEKNIKLFAEYYNKDENTLNGVTYISLQDRDKKIGKPISININK